MKKILDEIRAQFESVKGQPTLKEILAKDQEWQAFCQEFRRQSAENLKVLEKLKTQQSSVSNGQRISDDGELHD